MRAITIALGLLVSAFATNARAQSLGHTCVPTTIGDAVLKYISSDFNAGFDNEKPDAHVRGFQLHIDRDDNAIPDTSFIKWPDPWPVDGADSRNRRRIGPASFVLAGSKDFGITLSLDGINAKSLEVGYSCHATEFGGALANGALRAELELETNSPEAEIQLEFQLHIAFDIAGVLKVDEWIRVDLVDIDLPDDHPMEVIAALVPEVSTDRRSVKLIPHVNIDEVANQVTFTQFLDELAGLHPFMTNAISNLLCAPTGLGSLCVGPVYPIVGIVVGIAVEELRKYGVQKLRQYIGGYVQCLLEPFNRAAGAAAPQSCDPMNPPAPGENKFIESLGDRLRAQIAKLELPKRIAQLPIPNYSSVAKYEPDFVQNLCPAP
jgi:hypothetical protein